LPGVNRPGRQVDQGLPSIVDFTNEWSYTCPPAIRLRGVDIDKFYNKTVFKVLVLCYNSGCSRIGAEEDFEPKRNETIQEWRRLHNEELYDLYSSPKINRVKNRRMR